jgi:signal transduction histidine kinase
MSNPFKDAGVINLYQQKNTLKYSLIAVSVIIAVSSIYYTNLLVEELKEREERLINLYARGIEFAANEDNSNEITFFTQEIIVPNNNIPSILVNSSGDYMSGRNLDVEIPDSLGQEEKNQLAAPLLATMQAEHDPIPIELRLSNGEIYESQYVYYKNSYLLTQLKYYPYVQLSVIAGFAILAYVIFSYSRTAEQNRVWAGMAKETAHQLGTPLSSLMAWVEYFKTDPDTYNESVITELEKDIHRLEMITSRFSSIGSLPALKEENIHEVITGTMAYLQNRISSKVNIQLEAETDCLHARINKPLFDWVIENISKNAIDAMSGVGTLTISLKRSRENKVLVDITDTGKGIPKSRINQVFTPGYTTKRRGWGLGLSLAQRIIEHYHKGKIFVKSSEVNVGTTFRIVLNP